MSVTVAYTPDGYEQMLADQAAPEAIYYRVTLPPNREQSAGDVHQFRAFPTPELQGDDIGAPLDFNLNLRMTGQPTYTKGAAA